MHRRVEAVVQAGDVVTRYVRAGSGAPVVLLEASAAGGEDSPLFRHLAEAFRVVRPILDAALWSAHARRWATAPDRWLAGVIDGLGLERPALVLAPELASSLPALLDSGGVQLSRVVVLADVSPSTAEPPGAAFGDQPLLHLRSSAREGTPGATDELERLVAFLADRREAAGAPRR